MIVTSNRFAWTAEKDNLLLAMHRNNAHPLDMARVLGCAESTVKFHLSRHGLKPHHRAGFVASYEKEGAMPKSKVNPLRLAEMTLGKDFDLETMRFRGMPIDFFDLMRETNERLKAAGMEQWKGEESCVIR